MIRALMIVLVSVALACCATLPCAAGHDKEIALTFDDVPREPGAFMTMAERQKRLIAALKLAHVRRVAFFTNPGHLDRAKSPDYPEPIMAYANAGHIIANHSFTHSALSEVSVQAYLEDVDRADTWLRGRKNFRPWYRFPYLDEGGDDVTKRDAVRAALKARGLFDAAITVDGWDWNMEDRAVEAVKTGKVIDRAALKDMFVTAYVDEAECADALARKLLGRAPAQVMLLHEADVTTMFLGDLVKSLRAHGWKIVSPDTSYRDPIYRIKTKEPPAEGPLLTELARDRGIDTPTTCRWNDDAFANSEFDRRVLHRPS